MEKLEKNFKNPNMNCSALLLTRVHRSVYPTKLLRDSVNVLTKWPELQMIIVHQYLTHCCVSLPLLPLQSSFLNAPGMLTFINFLLLGNMIPVFRDHPVFNAANATAQKTCEADGNWWTHPDTNLTWSDYTNCVPQSSFHELLSIIISIIGNSLSLIFLVISLIIFFVSTSLQCGRVTMHKNLFLAFAMRY